MERLLVTMDDEMYEDLRRLAFENKAPMAKLVRFAIDKAFEDDLDVIAGMRATDERVKDPSGRVTIGEYMGSRGIAIPDNTRVKSGARSRRAAN